MKFKTYKSYNMKIKLKDIENNILKLKIKKMCIKDLQVNPTDDSIVVLHENIATSIIIDGIEHFFIN